MDALLNLLGVASLYLIVEYCLARHSPQHLEEASLLPFADDPEVARRVELATGRKVQAVAPPAPRPGWGEIEA